jgi:hypothetical protein
VKQKTLRLFLTGGIGNQLFQIAAAKYFAQSRRIELDVVTANPRKNLSGDPELFSLDLPIEIEIISKNQGTTARKIFGYNLRSGYNPKTYEKSAIFRFVRESISSLTLSFLLKKPFRLSVSSDLGNDSSLQSVRSNQILIGYFQTYYVARELLEMKDELFFNVCDKEYSRYKEMAEQENPLLVHVRLGDYQSDDSFGLLSPEYYKSAISEIWNSGKYHKVWLFSDEPNQAIERIPEEFRVITRVIENNQKDSAEILRIMTLCKGFVIANSTFSWWAAYLREDKEGVVVAPTPWFSGLSEPTDLIPPEWKRIKGFSSST